MYVLLPQISRVALPCQTAGRPKPDRFGSMPAHTTTWEASLKHVHFLAALIVGLASVASSHASGSELNRTLTIIVPFAAGGIADQIARLVGERISSQIGQPVIVENRTGANGQAAVAALKSTAPDGHTLLLVSHGMMAINPALYPNLAYSPTKDFVPLTLAIEATHLLLVPASSTAKDPTDLVSAAKRQPGALKFASVGIGSGGHLAAELFKAKAKIDVTHVPYRGSTAALPDVVAGRIDFFFDGPANSLELVRSGQLRALAVTDDRRMPQLPDVRTMEEAGFPNQVLNSWFGFVVLAGTPRDVVARLHSEIVKAIKQPSYAQKVAQFGAIDAANESIEDFARFIDLETSRLRSLIKAAGVMVQ
jgi:tripartite-type tricarboxylate transporter receptor subunit TctC